MKTNIILILLAFVLMGLGTSISGCEQANKFKDKITSTVKG